MDTRKSKAVVTESNCPHYAGNDIIFFDGQLIGKAKSDKLCILSVNAIFPYVYAARQGFFNEGSCNVPTLKRASPLYCGLPSNIRAYFLRRMHS